MKYKLFGGSGLRVSELALGTMTFALGANDGVWADVAAGDVTFAAGDRIEVVAPGAVNGIGEVAITVPLLLP